MRKKPFLIAALAAVISLPIAFVFGPDVIHAAYAKSTPSALIEQLKVRYNALAGQEASLSAAERQKSGMRRTAIWYWLHMRGFGVDEGMAEEKAEALFPMAVWYHSSSAWSDMWHYWSSPTKYKEAAFLLSDFNENHETTKTRR